MQTPQLPPPSAASLQPVSIAEQLEQAFLEEMLKYCGQATGGGGFSGGAGEAQFSSFLTREHAATLARQMDLGFANMLPRGRT